MNHFISITLIAVSVWLFFGYINPTYRKVTASSVLTEKSIVELKEDKIRYEDARDKVREIELVRTGLLQKYNSISTADRDKLLKLLPDHIDSVRLIIDINNIAAKHDMTLKNITLIESDGGGARTREDNTLFLGSPSALYSPVELKFSVSGSYDTLRAFLRDIERSLRLIDVRAFTFAAGAESVYDYQVTIHTYRLK